MTVAEAVPTSPMDVPCAPPPHPRPPAPQIPRRIVVMGAGRVVEVGSPAELLARPGSAFGAMVDETGQAASVLRAAAVKHVGVEGSTSQTA